MKVTIFLFLFCLAVVNCGIGPPRHQEPFVCNPSIIYQKNRCNYCMCFPGGGLSCTQMTCEDMDAPWFRCLAGTAWLDELCPKNKCWCVDNSSVCTTTHQCGGSS